MTHRRGRGKTRRKEAGKTARSFLSAVSVFNDNQFLFQHSLLCTTNLKHREILNKVSRGEKIFLATVEMDFVVCADVCRLAMIPARGHLPLAMSGNAAPLFKSFFIRVLSVLIRG